MAKIDIDYRLKPNTLFYGQFLVDMFTLDPEASFERSHDHTHKPGTEVFCVGMDDSVACMLKLKYGDCLAGPRLPRIPPKEKDDLENIYYDLNRIVKKKYLEEEYSDIDWFKKIINTSKTIKLDILKQRNTNNFEHKIFFPTDSEDYK